MGRILIVILCCTLSFAAKAQEALRADINPDSALNSTAGLEIRPQFPGGMEGWREFLTEKINSEVVLNIIDRDSTLSSTGLKQKIIVEFIVCEDGGLCNFSVPDEGKFYPELVSEALRVMRQSPRWIPGEKDGAKVKVRFAQSIWFYGD